MINDYNEIKECVYKNEHYSVRDNGAIMRHPREGKKVRKDDSFWTFGIKNWQTGYMHFGNISGHRVHIIVATAFLGAKDSNTYVVDHIDTNRSNNRIENLRWFTRLENALNNEITRNKIIYICGSIEAFIQDPSILRARIAGSPSLEWMRTVTPEEATIAFENIKQYWEEQAKYPKPLIGGKMDDRIFHKPQILNQNTTLSSNKDTFTKKASNSTFFVPNNEWEQMTQSLKTLQHEKEEKKEIIERHHSLHIQEQELQKEDQEFVQAKFPAIAWQKRWKTPTTFLCCPSEISDNIIKKYFDNLIIGGDYNSTLFYENNEPSIQKVIDKAYVDDNSSILVFSTNESGIKPYALSKIYILNDKIIHESIGTFFEEIGARKEFTLAQGLEWTGGDCIDDYC
jgi:hypothetical protein